MNKEALEEVFRRVKGLKIVVCGDVMLDIYTTGKVERISPEAPVPVVEVEKSTYRPGGAANVAVNLAVAGANVYLTGLTGNDQYGEILVEECSKKGVHPIFLPLRNKTTVKERIIGGGQQIVRLDREENNPLTHDHIKRLITHLKGLIADIDPCAVVMEDYDKGFFSLDVIHAIVMESRRKDIFTGVDPKKRNFHHYNGVTLFKPNLKEFTEGVSLHLLDGTPNDRILEKMRDFKKQKNMKYLMVTMGKYGIMYLGDEEEGIAPARAREVVDITGAGDTVFAFATIGLVGGLPLKETAILCNIAAGISCSHLGVYAPSPQEILLESQTTLEGIPQK